MVPVYEEGGEMVGEGSVPLELRVVLPLPATEHQVVLVVPWWVCIVRYRYIPTDMYNRLVPTVTKKNLEGTGTYPIKSERYASFYLCCGSRSLYVDPN